MAKSKLVSLRQILGDDFPSYIQREIIPALRKGIDNRQISPEELQKIADLIQREGLDGFDTQIEVLGDASSNNVERNGQLLDVITELPGNLSVRNFIKMFSVEDFDRAVRTQRSLKEIVDESEEFRTSIPEVRYVNPKRSVLTTPFIEGRTLREELSERVEAEKEERLKLIIADYVNLFNFLNERKSRINAPEGFNRDYAELFRDLIAKEFPEDEREKLVELYRTNIGNRLQRASTRFVHGDLKTDSIIVNGHSTYIDGSRARKNGFLEYDIGQLLRTAHLDEETEERIVRYSAELINPSNTEESVALYHINRVNEDILAAIRHLERARRNGKRGISEKVAEYFDTDRKERKRESVEKLRKYAVYRYNSALKRMNAHRNLFNNEFIAKLRDFDGLERISEEELKRLEKEFSEEEKTSIEYIRDTRMRTTEENLGIIDKKARREMLRPYTRRALLGLGALVVGAVAIGGSVTVFKSILEKKQEEEWYKFEDSQYHSHICSTFENYIRRYADPLKKAELITDEFLEEAVKEILPEKFPEVDEFFGSNFVLVRKIANIYRIGGRVANQGSRNQLEGIIILDPHAYYDDMDLLNEGRDKDRFKRDLKRLRECLHNKENKSLYEALYEFFGLADDPSYYIDPVRQRVRNECAENYALNTLVGPDFATDGGMNNYWLGDSKRMREFLEENHPQYKPKPVPVKPMEIPERWMLPK